jgi:signal transduction histidine kinase
MLPFASGAAFVDRTGAVIAADAGFLARLGLDGDPSQAVRARAESSPELRALLAGEGPSRASVPAAGGGTVELERVASADGALLLVRDAWAEEWGEHALRSQGLGRLAAGVAHDIKNPLNAMSLQIALLSEKLSGGGEERAAAGHLAALGDQISRVNEVLRRMLDVLDPAAPLGYMDLGALASDVVSLFSHDARRRRIEVALDGPSVGVRTRCDVSRVGRLVLGLCAVALARTPDGGRFAMRVQARGREVALSVEHTPGDPDGGAGYDTDVLAAGAASLGGRLELERDGERAARLTLVVPGIDHQ